MRWYSGGLSVDGQLGHGSERETIDTLATNGLSGTASKSIERPKSNRQGKYHIENQSISQHRNCCWVPTRVKILSGQKIKQVNLRSENLRIAMLVQVSCGGRHTLALTVDGSVYSFGHGGNGMAEYRDHL